MIASIPNQVFVLFTYLLLLVGSGSAQRPSNASVCDYYAQSLYGANSSTTQLRWIQNVVCLAFEGGSTLKNVSPEIKGILRPGRFDGIDINLVQYFNGSTKSTNVNNAPIGVNWLDDGGTVPLAAFLSGESQSLVLADDKNQYHLFSNFFVAFARSFGCTLPPNPLPKTNGPVSLAYAHKFMSLEHHQLGYFINQLSLASAHYGVSAQDADTFRSKLNNQFNVRCAPGVSINPSNPPQLPSLCQNPTCPLAVPSSDCAAYVNLTASGLTSNNPTTVTSVATMTAASSETAGPSTPTSSATPAHSHKPSTGAIAGIAIGGTTVLLIAIIALVYFRRKRGTPAVPTEPAPAPTWSQHNFSTPTVQPQSVYSPKNNHVSYYSASQSPSDARSRGASPDSAVHQGYHFHSGYPSGLWTPVPVEMEGVQPVNSGYGMSPAAQNEEFQILQRHSEGMPMQSQEYYGQQLWSDMNMRSGA